MCLPLVARVLALDGEQAEIALCGDGRLARVSAVLCPTLAAGDFVLVDRGLVLETISEAEAETMLAFYAELAEMGALPEDGEEEDPFRLRAAPPPAHALSAPAFSAEGEARDQVGARVVPEMAVAVD